MEKRPRISTLLVQLRGVLSERKSSVSMDGMLVHPVSMADKKKSDKVVTLQCRKNFFILCVRRIVDHAARQVCR